MSERFDTTRWSVVLAARDGEDEQARQALAWLCAAYWRPIYAYIRRRGHDPDEAADRTQGYFALLLEKNYLADIREERGRFRSFLLKSVQHFLSNEWHRERAAKRGGGRAAISLDGFEGERRLALEPRDERTPEVLFERQWALTLLDRAMGRLEAEAQAKGRGPQFALLRGCLTDSGPTRSYADLARELRATESAVKVAVHRLRRRFGELLRSEISETVADPLEVEVEIRHLFTVLETAPWPGM